MSDTSSVRTLDMVQELRDHWVRLLAKFVAHPSYAVASFDSLVERYCDDSRHSYTLEHVARVVSLIEDLAQVPSSAPDDLVPVELAGFFCHVVHDPGASDNEKQSAEVAGTWLDGLAVPEEVIAETQRLILLTGETDGRDGDRNGAVLLDSEMAVLGDEPHVYDRHLEDLRRDHLEMSEAQYAQARRGVVVGLLAREHIFHTSLCQSTLEPLARMNLMRELESLGGRSADARQAPEAHRAARAGALGVAEPPDDDAHDAQPLTRMELRRLSVENNHSRRASSARTRSGFSATRRARWVWISLGVLGVLLLIFVAVQLLRPLPPATVKLDLPASVTVQGELGLPWPSQGQAAMSVQGIGSLGGVGATSAVPVASLTKIMTALVVLGDHPLGSGESGPSITVSPTDVQTYQADAATQQSVVRVVAGEQLSELQMIQGLLVGSGNNLAEMLANWDSGNANAFVAKMNAKARALGLEQTQFVSPSGLEDTNVSSARDLIRLAEAALGTFPIAQVVSQAQVTLPVVGTIYNFDYDLGHDGIVGVKTGSSTAAGGCFVFLARRTVDGRDVAVIGAVLGQRGLSPLTSALDSAEGLVQAAYSSLRVAAVVPRGAVVGRIVAPWGATAPVVAGADASLLASPGMSTRSELRASRAPGLGPGSQVGRLYLRLGTEVATVPVVLAGHVGTASAWWRLSHL